MKYILILSVLLLIKVDLISQSCNPTCGSSISNLSQPEFYFYVKDNPGAYYKIHATAYEDIPVYDENFQITQSYRDVWERAVWVSEEQGCIYPPFYAASNNYTTFIGFDDVTFTNSGQGCRGVLGFGYYKVDLLRSVSEYGVYSTVFSFNFDTRDCSNYQDVFFHFDRNIDGSIIAKVDASTFPIRYFNDGETINLWEVFNQTKNWECFKNTVQLKNNFEGSPNQNVKLKCEFDPIGIYTGMEFITGNTISLMKGFTYNFSTIADIVNFNNKNYKVRDWNENTGYGSTFGFEVLNNSYQLEARFYPTQPLTVTNNLEGGTSSDNFELTWQNPSPPIGISWQYGSVYNAFNYQLPTNDLYTIKALPTDLRYGTSWQFFNWNTGSMYDTIRNIKVNAPVSFTANYKGHFRADNSSAYTSNSQQKTVRDDNGYYHTVYSSMGNVWYTHSLTSDFNGNWSQEEWIGENAKNPAIDYYGNNILIVLEHNLPSTAAISKIEFSWNEINGRYEIGLIEDIAFYPASFFGNAKPVITYTNGEIYVAYKESASSQLKFWRKYQVVAGTWLTEYGYIPYTTANSLNVVLAGTDSPNVIHIAWQERTSTGTANSIKYMYSTYAGNNRSYSVPAIISNKSGFIHNLNPSISYYTSSGSCYPIVSWTGKEDEGPVSRTVVRPKGSTLWGSYLVTGSNVVNTVNQSVTGSDNTVIAWSESNGTTRYARRINAEYSCVGSELSYYGTDISLSGGNSLSQIKALVFKGTGTPPYLINKSTTDFSANCIFTEQALSKITETDTIVTFGRSGVAAINDIEFIFEIGDILVGDSIVKFIEIPDTLAYPSAIELNQHTRTNNFTLSSTTDFYFSNIYRVVQKSNPDTALTGTDAVNFKVELVNANTEQVIGTFDNITYNKNNLEKYANIDYEVDCSGITAGEYFLRLITSVNGDADYALANIVNDNTTLEKKNYNKVNFTGNEIPASYSLAQNFPNPFNPSTTIRYQLPASLNPSKGGTFVTLKIYDILGSEVATLVNEQKAAGRYEVNFNASSLASGVYIYKIQAGDFSASKKLILLK